MGNVMDYLKWRGDVTLEESEFNLVDNLLFCILVYADLKGIVPALSQEGSIRILDAAGAYRTMGRREANPLSSKRNGERVLYAMALSPRFSDVRLSDFQEVLDEKEGIQFAAMTLHLPDGSHYVAFRGTDDFILGWREDFAISFREVGAQKMAYEYLNQVTERGGTYRVGGHSKGGNLAVYGSMHCRNKSAILDVYANDGPGICPELTWKEGYEEIRDRITAIVPEFSIVGMLFQDREPDYVVKSSAHGIMQHDPCTWQVSGAGFERAEKLNEVSRTYNRLFDEWIEDVSMEQRELFTRDFFDAIESGGARLVTELAEGGLKGFEGILFSMGKSDQRTQRLFGNLLQRMRVQLLTMDWIGMLREKRMVLAMITFVLGMFFICIPNWSLHVIGAGFFLAIQIYAAFHVLVLGSSLSRELQYERVAKRNGGEGLRPLTRREKWSVELRLILYGGISIVGIFCLFRRSIIVFSTSIILTITFVWRGAGKGKRSLQERQAGRRWKLELGDGICSLVMAIVSIAFSRGLSARFLIVVGSYLVVSSLVELGREVFSGGGQRTS